MTTFVLDGRTIQDHFPGIGRYAFCLAQALAENFPAHRFRLVIEPRAANTRFDLRTITRLSNVELVETQAQVFSLDAQRLGRRRALVQGASLWHSPYYAFPLTVSLPLVITLADLTPLVLPGEMPGAAKRLVYRLLNQVAARRAHAIITFSEASRRDLQRLNTGQEKITVVPLAPSPGFEPASDAAVSRVRASLDLPREYALYVGSNKPHKNLPRLIQSWARVNGSAALVIAGVWDARFPQAQEWVTRLNLQERVLFRHAVAESDLPALFTGARVFVFPSLHEGFGLPPLEAMACGTPVVTSAVSSLPEVAGDAACLVDPLDVHALTEALTRVLEDNALRENLRDKGLRRAQQFSWARTARDTMCVYETVME